MEATYEGGEEAWGAGGFVNSANDSPEQKSQIKRKFKDDLDSALSHKPDLKVFVFFTNVDLTPTEQQDLKAIAVKGGLTVVEIFYRERLRHLLDSTHGLAARYQYLQLELSPAEQAAFFAAFGSELQTLIARKFESVDRRFRRLEFQQDCNRPLLLVSAALHLKRVHTLDELGHFRVAH